jgi:cytochrome c556
MKKLIIILAAGAAFFSAALAHEGHEHATGVVRERIITMTSMGERLLAMSRLLRSNKNLERTADEARAIHDLAAKISSQFPAGSTQAPTAAKPAVWQDWSDFAAKAKNLEAEAEKLTQTSTTDGGALRAQFRAVARACDECHEKYRITK